MNKNIVLAVDAAPGGEHTQHVSAAAAMTRELSRDSGDHVVVLHVHEFSVGRYGRIRVDCADGEGEQTVQAIVADLKGHGISVEPEIRETHVGHIAAAILAAAHEHAARMIVLGSTSRTDLPRIPLGSVATRLLHTATLPVLIVPRSD